MKVHGVAGSLLAGVAGLLGCCTTSFAAPPMSIKLVNESGFADSQVFIGFVGGNTIDATNTATNQQLALCTAQTPNWYTLNQLPSGITLNGYSGRIYVCYGSQWVFDHPGYEPNPTYPADANYDKRYDKFELTYFGNSSDIANTTSFDYFSIPIEMNAYKGSTLRSTLHAPDVQTVLNAVKGLTSPAGAAVITDSNNKFVRVNGPGLYPPAPGLPAEPYHSFDSYLTYLRDTYAPQHSNVVATVKGHFVGVGTNPTDPVQKPQDYQFSVTINANKDITITGNGSVVGNHTMLFKYADLLNPAGIYGANPALYFDGSTSPTHAGNDIYGWLIADFLAGLNIGAVGSTVLHNGTEVGQMNSQDWFKLPNLFAALQPNHPDFYNPWAGTMSTLTDAYTFAYSDRFDHVVTSLDPSYMDTLELVLGGETLTDLPEPSSMALLATGSMGLLVRRRR